jgi:hypothetical protein
VSGPQQRRRSAGQGEKWKVNRAVRAAPAEVLPSAQTLIMLVLSDIADAGTAQLPPSKNPSTARLAFETGLGVSTVKKHRAALQAAGWIEYRPPTLEQQKRHESGTYRLRVPEGHQVTPVTNRPGSARDRERGQGVTPIPVSTWPGSPSPGDPLSNNDQNNDQKTSPAAVREAIDRVCQHLADRIEANGTPRPPIDGAWRSDAAALLFDDGHGEERTHKAIDFAHDDTFWRINITSPAKLRAKWHELRLSAERARQREASHNARLGAVPLPPPVVPNGPQRPAPPDIVATARAALSENRTSFHAADARHHRTNKQEP